MSKEELQNSYWDNKEIIEEYCYKVFPFKCNINFYAVNSIGDIEIYIYTSSPWYDYNLDISEIEYFGTFPEEDAVVYDDTITILLSQVIQYNRNKKVRELLNENDELFW